MFCTKCGKENPDDARFCGGCGYDFNSASKEVSVKEKRREVSIVDILLCVFLSFVGFIIAIIALCKGESRRGLTMIGIAIISPIIFGTISFFSILAPALSRAKESAHKTKCASNLKVIGLGLIIYANENNERFPDKLSDLYPSYISEKRVFRCLSDNLVTVETNASIEKGVPFTKNQCSYGYDNTHTQEDSPGVALAADRPSNTASNTPQDANSPNHGGSTNVAGIADVPGKGQNVVYLDGHVEYVNSPFAGDYDKRDERDNIYVKDSTEGKDTYIIHDGK